MIAEVADPGIPRLRSGTKEPPTAALFALSGAIIPSMLPFPKRWGSLDNVIKLIKNLCS